MAKGVRCKLPGYAMPDEPHAPYLTRTEFARVAGVRKATVFAACKPGRALAPAYTGEGKAGRVDAQHLAAVAYLAKHAGKPKASEAPKGRSRRGRPTASEAKQLEREAWDRRAMELAAQRAARRPAPVEVDPVEGNGLEAVEALTRFDAMEHDLPEHIKAVLDWPLRKVVRRYGNIPAFESVLKSAKVIASIDETRTKTEQRRGNLVDRDFVKVHVMGAIADSLERLLQDTPRGVCAAARELIESGATDEEVEGKVHDLIASQIRGMKARALKGIRKRKSQEVFDDA